MKTLLGSLALMVALSFMGVSTAVASDQPTTITAKDGDGDKDGKRRHHRKHHRKHHHKRHHKHEEQKPADEKK